VKNAGDVLLMGTRAVVALDPSASSSASRLVTVPLATPIGTYYLLACADDTGKVTENDNANNCRSSATRVTAAGPNTPAILNANKKVVGIQFLQIGNALYDVTFAAGGLSYDQALQSLRQPNSMVSFGSSAEAIAALNAIRAFFNTSEPPIKPSDVWWDTLNNSDSRGDVVVPYGVTATLAPYAYSGWDGPTQTWIFSGLFGFERDRQLTSAAAWTFFTRF
jgi:hypothetical protein